MAAKKKKAEALTSQADPKAPLAAAAFLGAAQKTLKVLADDLLARVDGSASITAGLKARWEAEQKERRTGDAFEPWRRRFVVQVGVAWTLGCVFARTLEDRGLVERHRVAGPGAADSVRQFLEMAPHLTEREYLLTVFRELANLPAARDLFDARHNPVWKLAPSADGAKALLDLFRAPNGEAPAFRFGQSDTRFLGDLYQDLSDEVRERFALLQTPRFVESFILDQTLEPAIREFGLEQATIIDPTCGSGHFLLGAFERLIEHRLRAQPGLDVREAAVKALDAVYGADINPYAVAIARFRLVLAFLERGSYTSLAQAPELPLHVVVGDSLLHGVGSKDQEDFAHMPGVDPSRFSGELFSLDDGEEAKVVMRKRYAAVVGNPPYITVKDPVLREEYRKRYLSAAGKYSLAAPFAERFFELARDGGFVGTITANSFMKREFGKRLIETVFRERDLTLVVNTQGAYIPGHGTPTVLLFGRNQTPVGDEVRAVLAKRGEPSTPEDAAQGLVWRSIVEHLDDPVFENEFISTARVSRPTLGKHPWSLGGGGASELKELLEERASDRLSQLVASIGFMAITGEDECFVRPAGAWHRAGAELERIAPFITGETIRDWGIAHGDEVFFPYANASLDTPEHYPNASRCFWPYRTVLLNRPDFGGKKYRDVGRTWFEFHQVPLERLRVPLSIAFAFVATHNHFVLDRGGKVFNRSAPIIKLPPDATEDDHLALLAYLNSSTAAFFFRQAGHSKGGQGINEGHKAEEWEQFLEYSGALVGSIPVPERTERAVFIAKRMVELAEERAGLDPGSAGGWVERDRELEGRLCRLQEELDWHFYSLFGFLDQESEAALPGGALDDAWLAPGRRPFEHVLARPGSVTAWFRRHQREAPTEETEVPPLDRLRIAVIDQNQNIRLLESPHHKRRWMPRDYQAEESRWINERRTQALEATVAERDTPTLAREAGSVLADAAGAAVDLFEQSAVPFLAAFRFSEEGLEKHGAWIDVWAQQRREDASETDVKPAVPPKFGSTDYRAPTTWQIRGKLDVPKERFISYPGCESDEDRSPAYGWAGWDHLQRAQALSALYQKRRREEGWGKDRLTPMLAGLQELVPWLKQWHNEPDPNFNGTRLGDFFADFVAAECQSLGLTLDDLRAWRPPAKTRAAKAKKKTAPEASPESETQPSLEPKPKKKRPGKASNDAKTEHAAGASVDEDVLPSAASIAFAKRHGFLAE